MSVELIPLGNITIDLRPPQVLQGTPSGTRMVFEVESAKWNGDRISATSVGQSAADWMSVSASGVGTLDVRAMMQTDDGALIFVQYNGRTNMLEPGVAPIYAAPRFETGDERYAWLNLVQAVSTGTLDGMTLTYEIYEVR